MGNQTLHDLPVLVIGLGRFGSGIANALTGLGHDVLAMDTNPRLVQQWSGKLTHVVEADGTNPAVIDEVGGRDFPIAVVGIGTSIEASVLATANLADIGTSQIWAKAISGAHGRILERIGAHHVVYPEADAGRRVAQLVNGRLLDYMEFGDGFAIVKMMPPRETQGFTLAESKVREKYGVTVVGLKRPGEEFTYADSQTRVHAQDLLIVSGHHEHIERFAARP